MTFEQGPEYSGWVCCVDSPWDRGGGYKSHLQLQRGKTSSSSFQEESLLTSKSAKLVPVPVSHSWPSQHLPGSLLTQHTLAFRGMICQLGGDSWTEIPASERKGSAQPLLLTLSYSAHQAGQPVRPLEGHPHLPPPA